MNRYESIFIIASSVTEEDIKEFIEKIKNLITTNGGNVTNVEELGKKKLAYEIKKNKEGYYVLIEFDLNAEVIKELERVYRITDEIIKFLTIRKDDKE